MKKTVILDGPGTTRGRARDYSPELVRLRKELKAQEKAVKGWQGEEPKPFDRNRIDWLRNEVTRLDIEESSAENSKKRDEEWQKQRTEQVRKAWAKDAKRSRLHDALDRAMGKDAELWQALAHNKGKSEKIAEAPSRAALIAKLKEMGYSNNAIEWVIKKKVATAKDSAVCPACKGTGHPGEQYWKECKKCGGTGKAPAKDASPKYNAEAVQKAINNSSKKIGGKEAKTIHRLLQGRTAKDASPMECDKCGNKFQAVHAGLKCPKCGSTETFALVPHPGAYDADDAFVAKLRKRLERAKTDGDKDAARGIKAELERELKVLAKDAELWHALEHNKGKSEKIAEAPSRAALITKLKEMGYSNSAIEWVIKKKVAKDAQPTSVSPIPKLIPRSKRPMGKDVDKKTPLAEYRRRLERALMDGGAEKAKPIVEEMYKEYSNGECHKTIVAANNYVRQQKQVIDPDKLRTAKDENPFERDTDVGAAKIVKREAKAGLSVDAIVKKYGFSKSFVEEELPGAKGKDAVDPKEAARTLLNEIAGVDIPDSKYSKTGMGSKADYKARLQRAKTLSSDDVNDFAEFIGSFGSPVSRFAPKLGKLAENIHFAKDVAPVGDASTNAHVGMLGVNSEKAKALAKQLERKGFVYAFPTAPPTAEMVAHGFVKRAPEYGGEKNQWKRLNERKNGYHNITDV